MDEVDRGSSDESLRAGGVQRGARVGQRHISTKVDVRIDRGDGDGASDGVADVGIDGIDVVAQRLGGTGLGRVRMEVHRFQAEAQGADRTGEDGASLVVQDTLVVRVRGDDADDALGVVEVDRAVGFVDQRTDEVVREVDRARADHVEGRRADEHLTPEIDDGTIGSGVDVARRGGSGDEADGRGADLADHGAVTEEFKAGGVRILQRDAGCTEGEVNAGTDLEATRAADREVDRADEAARSGTTIGAVQDEVAVTGEGHLIDVRNRRGRSRSVQRSRRTGRANGGRSESRADGTDAAGDGLVATGERQDARAGRGRRDVTGDVTLGDQRRPVRETDLRGVDVSRDGEIGDGIHADVEQGDRSVAAAGADAAGEDGRATEEVEGAVGREADEVIVTDVSRQVFAGGDVHGAGMTVEIDVTGQPLVEVGRTCG